MIFDERRLLAGARRLARESGGQGAGADFLIREIAADLADRLGDVPRDFGAGLFLGPGSGAILPALGAQGAVITHVIDPGRDAPGAAEGPAAAGAPAAVPWTGATLPLDEGAHDLAVSAMLLHRLDDPVGHLVQLRRALRPDGLMLAALLGGQTLHELRAALAEAEVEITGNLAARVAPMGEIRDLGALLQRAGLAMPVADSRRLTVSYESALHLMRDLRAMGESGVLADRRPLRRDVLMRAAGLYAEHFGDGKGRVTATFEIVFLTGWAPGPDQPVAKRPGSATARLADVLGSVEQSAGEKAGR